MKEDWVSSDNLIWAMLRFSHKAQKVPALGFFKGEFSLPEGLILWTTSTNIAAVSRCFIAAFQNVFGCLVSCSRPSFSIFTQHLLLWMFFVVAAIAFVVFLKPLTKRGKFLNVWVLTPPVWEAPRGVNCCKQATQPASACWKIQARFCHLPLLFAMPQLQSNALNGYNALFQV